METLNSDCLIHIFGYLLPHEKVYAMEVCSEWKNLMPYVWRKSRTLCVSHEAESLYQSLEHISPETLFLILNCSSQFLTKIVFRFLPDCRNEPIIAELDGCNYRVNSASIHDIITILSEKCRNVHELKISKWELLEDDKKLLVHLIKFNKQLKKLVCDFPIGEKIGFPNVPRSLVHLVTSNENLSHIDFVSFCRETKGLEELYLLDRPFFTSLEFLKHVRNLRSLQWINLNRLIASPEIKNLSFLTNLQKLVLIGLAGSSMNGALKVVGSLCKNVKSLTLGMSRDIRDETVNSMITSLSELEVLRLHFLPLQSLIPSASVKKLLISLCSHFGIDSLNKIVRNMPSLRQLYFYYNDNSDNRLIEAVYVAINTTISRNLTFLTSEDGISEDGRSYYSFVAVYEGTELRPSGKEFENDSLFIAHFLPAVENLTQFIETYVEEQLKMCRVSHFRVWKEDLGTVLDRKTRKDFVYE